jgi:hypothetical protein
MTLERFADICRANPYRHKGMFYSEVFLFLQCCANHDVDIIVESGVKFGMSTALLRAGFDGVLISIDKDGVAPPIKDVIFFQGDSRKIIPQVLLEFATQRVAVLIDGPKGSAAVALMWDAMRWECVRLVGVHDLPRASESNAAAVETQHSHDPYFREVMGNQLDDLIQHDYRRKYPNGPGLAIWEKKL